MTRHLQCGIDAADALFHVFGLCRVRKNINDKDAFDKLVAAVSLAMAGEVEDIEARAFANVLALADVDWAALGPTSVNAVVLALEAAMPSPGTLVRPLMAVLAAKLPDILAQAANAVTIQVGGSADPNLNKVVVDYLRNAESLHVTDYLKRRNTELSARIRRAVATALEQGANRASVAAAIERVAGPASVLGRSSAYYDVVAGQFANQARVYGLLASMQGAGIQRYIFSAVLDEVTGEICRALDGTVFSVDAGLDIYSRLAASPYAAKQVNPWVRQGKGPSGEPILYVVDAFGHRNTVAEVLRSGAGNLDDRGEHRMMYSDTQLEAMGISVPPLHANCRSTIIADV